MESDELHGAIRDLSANVTSAKAAMMTQTSRSSDDAAALLKELERDAQFLQNKLNDGFSELTSGQLATCQRLLMGVKEDLGKMSSYPIIAAPTSTFITPQKTFSFRRRPGSQPIASSGATDASCGISTRDKNISSERASQNIGAGDRGGPDTGFGSTLRIADKNGGRFVFGHDSLRGRDVTLQNLRNCTVVILDEIGALRDSFLAIATKQLRLHESSRIFLSIHSVSSPVVEKVSNIVFGPFCFDFASRGHLWKKNGVAVDGRENSVSQNWKDVLDFNWHKKSKSPHWRAASLRDAPPAFSILWKEVNDGDGGTSLSASSSTNPNVFVHSQDGDVSPSGGDPAIMPLATGGDPAFMPLATGIPDDEVTFQTSCLVQRQATRGLLPAVEVLVKAAGVSGWTLSIAEFLPAARDGDEESGMRPSDDSARRRTVTTTATGGSFADADEL